MNTLMKKLVASATVLMCGTMMLAPGVGSAMTQDELQAQIDALLAQLADLQAQLDGDEETTPPTGGTIAGCVITSFDRNLKVGMTGDDVKCMQIVLNSDSATVLGESGAGSPGNETSYFGPITKAGVIKFQEKYTEEVLSPYGLTTGTGFVGSTTRAQLNVILAAGGGEQEEKAPSEIDNAVECITAGYYWGADGCYNGDGEEGEEEEEEGPAAEDIDNSTDCIDAGYYWGPDGCYSDETVAGEGTVAVSLASDTPATTSLGLGAVGVPIAAFNLAAGSDATLDSIKFTRSGLGISTDYSSVYIYDGATRLKSGRTISSVTNTVEFTNIGLALTEGTTTKLTVKVDVNTSGTGNINTLSVASADDISISGATVEGTFPMSANAMSLASVTIGSATVAPGSAISNPTLGEQGAKLTNMKITAGSNDIKVIGMALYQNGTISNTNLANFELKVGSDVVATTDSMIGEQLFLTLDTPYTITKNRNKTFSLYADILGGRTSDTVRFYLDENSDIQINDATYEQGAAITSTFNSSQTTSYVSSLRGGEITLVDNGPAADTVARNTTDVQLLNFGITSSRNVTVRDYKLELAPTNKFNALVTSSDTFALSTSEAITMGSASGTLAVGDYVIIATTGDATTYAPATDVIAKVTATDGSTTASVTPVAGTSLVCGDNSVAISTVLKIDAMRLVDADTGSVLYSYSTAFYGYNGDAVTNLSASDDFDLDADKTYNLSVRVDISEYSAAGMILTGKFDVSTVNDIKDYEANEYITNTDIVPNTLTGKNMTTAGAGLTVALASTPVSGTKVKGTDDVDILGISLTASSAGDVKMTSLTVRFIANDNDELVFTLGTGDVQANTVVASASIYDGSTKIAGPKSLVSNSWSSDTSGDYKATFDNLTYDVTAGASQKLTVRVNLKNTITASRYLAADVIAASDVVVEDTDGNALTITGAGISRSSSTDTTPVPYLTVNTAGTLSAKVEGSSDQAIVIAGTSNVVMAKYKFSALYEDFTIDKLEVDSDTNSSFTDDPTAEATNDNNIVRVGVKADGVTKWSNLTSGVANFSGLDITVPADGSVYVEILADLNTIANGATSGETPRLGISSYQNAANTFRAVGQGSSMTKTYTTLSSVSGESNVNAMTVRETAPTIVKAISGLSPNMFDGQNVLYGFTVTADSAEAVSMKAFALKMTATNAAINSSNFKLYRGSTNITDKVLIYNDLGTLETTTDVFDDANQQTVYILWDGITEETISAGNSNTYYVRADLAGTGVATYSISVYMADDAVVLSGATTALVAPAAKLAKTDITDAGELAEWSTTVAKYGSYSAKLAKDNSGSAGSTHLQFTPPTGITIADLDETAFGTTPKWSFWHYETATTNTNWAHFEMKFEDPDTNGYVEVTLMPLQATAGIVGWTEQVVTDDEVGAIAYYGKKEDGTTGFGTEHGSGVKTLADVEALINTAIGGTGISGNWVLTRIRIELWEVGPARTQHIDNVLIEGVEYVMEEINMLWSDNSNTSHTTQTADWFNGYLVDDLSTATHTLSF